MFRKYNIDKTNSAISASSQNKFKLVHLNRLLVHVVNTEPLNVIFELGCRESCQKYEYRLLDGDACLFALLNVEILQLLKNLNTIFQWHLEIKEHVVDWKKKFLTLLTFQYLIEDYSFNCVNRLLSINVKLSFTCQMQLSKNVFQNFYVDQLIVGSYYFLYVCV